MEQGVVAVYVHLDDVAVISSSATLTGAICDIIKEGMETIHFVCTERWVTDTDNKFIGFSADRSPARWAPTPMRLGDMDRALEMLSQANWVLVNFVHTVLSIFVWMALARRECLSIPQVLFQFTRDTTAQYRRLWPSARRELLNMRGALPLLSAALYRPVFPIVFAQDAAVEGDAMVGTAARRGTYCLAAAIPPYAEVDAVAMSIRSVGRSRTMPIELGGQMAPLDAMPSLPLHGRTKFPRHWFDDTIGWFILLAKAFRWSLCIAEAELRAAVMWLVWFTFFIEMRGFEVLGITDNTAVSGLYARGRSCKYELNMLMRRRAAIQLALDLRMFQPWIDTHHQPGDSGTRIERGQCVLGRVRWKKRTTLLLLGVFSSTIRDAWLRRNKDVKLWKPQSSIYHILAKQCRRDLMRTLESGALALILWIVPDSIKELPVDLRELLFGTLAISMGIAYSMGTPMVIIARSNSEIWETSRVIHAAANTGARIINVDMCMYGHHHRRRNSILFICSDSGPLSKICCGYRNRCDFSNRPHGAVHDSSDGSNCGYCVGSSHGLTRGFAEAFVANCSIGDGAN